MKTRTPGRTGATRKSGKRELPICFRDGVCITIQNPENAIALVGGRAVELKSRAYAMVLGLIDGVRNAGDLAKLLRGELEAAMVYYVIELLKRQELLAEGVTQAAGTQLRELLSVDTVLDIGCHRGEFLLTALRWWKPSCAVAVDPQPAELELARANAALCRTSARLVFVCCAAGPVAGEVDLWVGEHSATSAVRPPGKREVKEFEMAPAQGRKKVRAPMRTIDSISAESGLKEVDLLKLDVEGYEIQALEGAHETLARTSHLLIETTFGGIRENELAEQSAYLLPFGFRFQQVFNPIYSRAGNLCVADALFSRKRAPLSWAAH